jgi:carboxylesterase type B
LSHRTTFTLIRLRQNIYAPMPKDGRPPMPIILYFPAGQFTWGSGNDLENQGAPYGVPAAAEVIYITPGYRLGTFGFLALDELRQFSPDGSAGNIGMEDMRQAMRWIRANIHAIGGDPNNIVIQSRRIIRCECGSYLDSRRQNHQVARGNHHWRRVSSHLAAKKSFGLFHKAVVESGLFSTWGYRSWHAANTNAKAMHMVKALNCFFPGTGVANVSCLMNKDMHTMLQLSDDGHGEADLSFCGWP